MPSTQTGNCHVRQTLTAEPLRAALCSLKDVPENEHSFGKQKNRIGEAMRFFKIIHFAH